ncbi:unnamed protein product, partial [Brenthis ino]
MYYLEASIAGVTYMDNFDFAQRYRDVNECNPFYWHPLHLPEECKQMFEKLIRSKLESLTPYTIVKEIQNPAEFVYSPYRLNTPVYRNEFIEPFDKKQTLSPFEILFELLRSDFILILIWSTAKLCSGSSTGISYMDPLNHKLSYKYNSNLEDPCNPLYWYPKNIPEYCQFRINIAPNRHEHPVTSIPLPEPPRPSLPQLLPPVLPIAPPLIMPPPPPLLPIISMLPSAPLLPEFNIRPKSPYNIMLPQSQAGMVPGLPGIVSRDGGINIMPFSDAYADMLEKHKNKMIRKKLRKIVNKYDYYKNSRNYWN